MKVLMCGDRNWSDRETIRSWVAKLHDWGYTDVIEGEARGADRVSREEAEAAGMTVHPFPADWELYGKAAGPIRNLQMLDENPDLVVAFHNDLSQSKGTAHTVRCATAQGIRVIVVKEVKL